MAKIWFSKTKLDVSSTQWVAFKTPSTFEVAPEKIWSSDTGRGDDGTMQGSVVAVKSTLKMTWNKLTPAHNRLLGSYVTKCENFYVKYENPEEQDALEVIRVYAGTPTYPIYSYSTLNPKYMGVGVDLIEW